jgi:hypothetical protein
VAASRRCVAHAAKVVDDLVSGHHHVW